MSKLTYNFRGIFTCQLSVEVMMTGNMQKREAPAPLMIGRRGAILGLASLAMTACTQTLLESEAAQNVTIGRITVVTANVTQFAVRDLAISRQQFANDLEDAVRNGIGARARQAGNAELLINVNRLWLKSPGESLFIGGPSFVDAEVTVRDVVDGSFIAGPTKFSGISSQTRMGGIIGALSAPTAQEDYAHTLEGFARMINEALFEGGTTTY